MTVTNSANATERKPIATRGSNQSGMRAYNERLVLSLIRQSGPLAKSQITALTGLSAQSVSVIMRSLEADGLLIKEAPRRGRVGQPMVPMRLDPAGAYFFGLNVGRRSLELVLTDFEGRIIGRLRKAHRFPEPDAVMRFTNEGVARLQDGLPHEGRARIAGLGIAAPFRIWNWAGHLGVDAAELDGWRGRDIAAEIAENWDFPVILRNDATAACGAELVFGDQDKPREFLYFFVGFFIGGGLVLENSLYDGPTRNAAALGSMPVAIDGDRVRHLVDVASLMSLDRAVAAFPGEAEMNWDAVDTWRIPPDVLEPWLEEASAGIAQAVLSASCLIDFSCVVLDGWMPAEMRAELVRRVGARIDAIDIEGIEKPAIREGGIGPDARALGAASLPLSERFLVDRSVFLKG